MHNLHHKLWHLLYFAPPMLALWQNFHAHDTHVCILRWNKVKRQKHLYSQSIKTFFFLAVLHTYRYNPLPKSKPYNLNQIRNIFIGFSTLERFFFFFEKEKHAAAFFINKTKDQAKEKIQCLVEHTPSKQIKEKNLLLSGLRHVQLHCIVIQH